jgi:Uma2 family endonuclease
MTVAEFLARDDGSDVRYELLGGEIVAMAAPSRAHQILAVNFARRLAEALDGRPPCSAGAGTPPARRRALADRPFVDSEARLRLASIGFDQPLSSLYVNILPAAG